MYPVNSVMDESAGLTTACLQKVCVNHCIKLLLTPCKHFHIVGLYLTKDTFTWAVDKLSAIKRLHYFSIIGWRLTSLMSVCNQDKQGTPFSPLIFWIFYIMKFAQVILNWQIVSNWQHFNAVIRLHKTLQMLGIMHETYNKVYKVL